MTTTTAAGWDATEVSVEAVTEKGEVKRVHGIRAHKLKKTGKTFVDPADILRAQFRDIATGAQLQEARDIALLALLAAPAGKLPATFMPYKYSTNKMLFYQWKRLEEQGLGDAFPHDDFVEERKGPAPTSTEPARGLFGVEEERAVFGAFGCVGDGSRHGIGADVAAQRAGDAATLWATRFRARGRCGHGARAHAALGGFVRDSFSAGTSVFVLHREPTVIGEVALCGAGESFRSLFVVVGRRAVQDRGQEVDAVRGDWAAREVGVFVELGVARVSLGGDERVAGERAERRAAARVESCGGERAGEPRGVVGRELHGASLRVGVERAADVVAGLVPRREERALGGWLVDGAAEFDHVASRGVRVEASSAEDARRRGGLGHRRVAVGSGLHVGSRLRESPRALPYRVEGWIKPSPPYRVMGGWWGTYQPPGATA